MKIDRLIMEESIGALFFIISTFLSISNAIIEKSQFQSIYMYCASSNVSLTNFALSEAKFLDSGGLLTAEDNSILYFSSVNFTNLSSSAQGLILATWSTLIVKELTAMHFNEGFIVAEHSSLHFDGLHVQDGLVAAANKSLLLLSKGGFLQCISCLDVFVVDADFQGISAREGGVLYIEATKSVKITNSDFMECSALTTGGVVSISSTPLQIDNSLFQRNSAANGGVVYASSAPCSIHNSEFFGNTARTDGSCILWVNMQPVLSNNSFLGNSATYGNPMASTVNHFRVVESGQPVEPSANWVSGQSGSLTIGVFDAMEQLITTDNSTTIYVANLDSLNVTGTTQTIASEGVAEFTLLFTHFSSGHIEVAFAADEVESLNVTASLRDCVQGEVRKSFGCYPCPPSSYSFKPDDEDCRLCMRSADCEGKVDVRLYAGYWRAHNLTDDIYECMQPGTCAGGINSDCRDGFEGTLCGACSRGYFQWGVWDCRPCQEQVPLGVRIVLVAVLALASVVLAGFAGRGEGNGVLGVRFLLSYAQTAGFAQQLKMKWSFAALVQFEALEAVGSFGSEFLFFDCEFKDFPGFYGRLIATALYPVVLAVFAVCAWLLLKCCRVSMPSLVSLCAIELYLYMPVMLMMSGASLQCIEVAGSQWVVHDLHETCFSVQHTRALLAILLSTFLSALLLLACFLVSRKKYPSTLEFRKFLRLGYARRHKKWELLTQARWVCLAVLVAVCPRLDSMCQAVLMVLILSISTLVEAKVRPFSVPWFMASILWQSAMLLFLLVSVCGWQEGVGAGFFVVVGFFTLIYRSSRQENHIRRNLSQSLAEMLGETSKVVPACPNGSLVSFVESKV